MLLAIIFNNTFVLSEIIKKKRKERRAIWIKDWLKGREKNMQQNY